MNYERLIAFALIVYQNTCHGLLFNDIIGNGDPYVESNYVFEERLMCEDQLYEPRTEIICEDGRPLQSNGCCPPLPGSNKPMGDAIGCPHILYHDEQCTYSGCEKYPQFKKSLKMSVADRWVAAHNVFRCMHGLPDVKWNSDTAGYAQFWADNSAVQTGKGTAGECTMEHSTKTYTEDDPMWSPNPRTDGKAAENLAIGVNRPQTPEFSTQQWYEEINYYQGPNPPKDGKAVGHYTAMMWRDNREIGCATCRGPVTNRGGEYGYHDVCQYSNEPSNFGLSYKYAEQVPQNNDPVQTEAFCCDHAYSSFIEASTGPDSIATTQAATVQDATATDEGVDATTNGNAGTNMRTSTPGIDNSGSNATQAPVVSDDTSRMVASTGLWLVASTVATLLTCM